MQEREDGPAAGLGDAWLLVEGRLADDPRRGRPRPQGPLAVRAAPPLPRPRLLDAGGARPRDRRRAGPSLPRRPRDRRRASVRPATSNALTMIVIAFLASAVDLLGGDLRADLPGRLGRPACPPGPPRADLHPPAVDVARLLHPQPARGADLADDQRRPGARHARHRRHRDDGLQRPDARRRRRDPARDRRPARAGHVPDLPDPRDRQHRLPGRVGERLPADAGEDREHHRLPAGEPQRRSRRPQLRPGAPAPDRDVGPQRGEPRGQHADGLPQRLLLPGGRAAVGDRHGGDPAVRRLPGDQRQHRDRRPRSRSSATCRRSSTRSSRSASSTRPTSRGWPPSTRSSTCSTPSPTSSTRRTRSIPARSAGRSTSRASGSATPRTPAASRTGR